MEPIGIHYDDRAHVLTLDSGEIADVPTYSPAELVRHPLVEVYGIADLGPEARSTLGYEFAAALHALMWPTETPPGRPDVNYAQSFEDNIASIAARNGLPYRDAPPGGWWR